MKRIFRISIIIFFFASLFNNFVFAQNRVGSCGGNGGSLFEIMIPDNCRVYEVRIHSGMYVDSIQIFYQRNSQVSNLPKKGGGGGQQYRFVLYQGEYITGISGRCGNFVDSIRIHTNRRVSPRYGGEGGFRPFQFEAPENQSVVGFFGRSGVFIDAIGIITK